MLTCSRCPSSLRAMPWANLTGHCPFAHTMRLAHLEETEGGGMEVAPFKAMASGTVADSF